MSQSNSLYGAISRRNRKSSPNLPTRLTTYSLMLFHFCKPPPFEKPTNIDLSDLHASPWHYPMIHVEYPESRSRPISFPETFMQTLKFSIILDDPANDCFEG